MSSRDREIIKKPGSQVVQKMYEFARVPPESGVNNYNILGPIDVPTSFEIFVGLYPGQGLGDLIVGSTKDKVDVSTVFNKILAAKIPDRIEEMRIEDNPIYRQAYTSLMERAGMPIIMIGLGKARDTKKEVQLLWAILGVSPATGLGELQERIRLYRMRDSLRRERRKK